MAVDRYFVVVVVMNFMYQVIVSGRGKGGIILDQNSAGKQQQYHKAVIGTENYIPEHAPPPPPEYHLQTNNHHQPQKQQK